MKLCLESRKIANGFKICIKCIKDSNEEDAKNEKKETGQKCRQEMEDENREKARNIHTIFRKSNARAANVGSDARIHKLVLAIGIQNEWRICKTKSKLTKKRKKQIKSDLVCL